MLKERSEILRKVNITVDVCLTTLSFLLAYYMITNFKTKSFAPLLPIHNYLWLLCIILPLWGFFLCSNRVYQSQREKTLLQSSWKITKAILEGGLVLTAILFFLKVHHAGGRTLIVIFLIIDELFLVTERVILKYTLQILRHKGYNFRSVLVVGTGKRAQEFMNMVFRHKEWGLKIEGLVDKEASMVGESICGVQVVGVLEDLSSILRNSEIDEVFFIVPRSWLDILEKFVLACEEMGIKTCLAWDLFSHKIAKMNLQQLDGRPFLTFDPIPHEQGKVLFKGFLDVVLSSLILTIVWPLLLVITIIIRLTSEGPVFFKQRRCGLNGKKFTIFKFRTMVNGAEILKQKVEHLNEMNGPVFKVKNDPRITRIGKILRKTSMDELPQLFNVLKGDMSLVGPRPPVPSEVEKYEFWQRRRLSMKPGITCLWQVNGRNRIDFDKWMRLDLEYIDNWSLKLDVFILLKTIPAVVKCTGT